MNLLTIDWDYFFPQPPFNSAESFELWDWGHQETRLFIETLWPIRAASFLRAGRGLPAVNDEWKTFWRRFSISPKALLYYSESHCMAAHRAVARGIDQVWSYDAHHDYGYGTTTELRKRWAEGVWGCDDWLVFYGQTRGPETVHVRYPTHRTDVFAEETLDRPLDRAFDDGQANPVRFHRVHVARSGAWVPPWCDEAFFQFLDLFPGHGRRINLGLIERGYDPDETQRHLAMVEQLTRGQLS